MARSRQELPRPRPHPTPALPSPKSQIRALSPSGAQKAASANEALGQRLRADFTTVLRGFRIGEASPRGDGSSPGLLRFFSHRHP